MQLGLSEGAGVPGGGLTFPRDRVRGLLTVCCVCLAVGLPARPKSSGVTEGAIRAPS